MQHLPIARTSLLALLLATATSPAAAVVIGEPDNSLIMHYFGVSASAPNKYVEFSDYDSPAISVSGAGAFATVQDQFGVTYFGGSNTWTWKLRSPKASCARASPLQPGRAATYSEIACPTLGLGRFY